MYPLSSKDARRLTTPLALCVYVKVHNCEWDERGATAYEGPMRPPITTLPIHGTATHPEERKKQSRLSSRCTLSSCLGFSFAFS